MEDHRRDLLDLYRNSAIRDSRRHVRNEGPFLDKRRGRGYTYVGYPILLFILGRLGGRKPVRSTLTCPSVSLIIPAYNEASVIAAKLQQRAGYELSAERLEVIVVSDGSTDATDRLAAEVGGERVRVLRSSERRGKASAMNLGAASASGTVLLFTDANVFFDRVPSGAWSKP
jgi:cellulose synthase/poly-beta-1,6-N-acetylglucosamine synthase-like glycosyltransferase